MSFIYEDCRPLMCPNCGTGRLSDDGHSGNNMVIAPDGRIGIWYNGFFEGNWSPTPPGCYDCKKFYTLPDLIEVPYGARFWILDKGDPDDEKLKTTTGGYHTRRSFNVPVEEKV